MVSASRSVCSVVNGILLKAPVQLAHGEIECWSCHKPTPVVSIVAAELIE